LAEDRYTAADAVVVGGLLISLLKHADRVRCACIAQLVNVISPITTEPGGRAWRQSTFYPFAITSSLARGSVVRVTLDGPTVATPKFGAVPALDAVATPDGASGGLTVFAVNRDLASSADLELELPMGAGDRASGQVVTHADPHATNAPEAEVVVPAPLDARIEAGRLRVALPPVSWAAITVSRAG
jgi:alpha-N-arabinofuranosidase